MIGSPPNYSDNTVCPKCHTQVPLETVEVRTFFKCPHCCSLIRVRPSYLAAQTLISQCVGFCISYSIGLRWAWFVLLGVVFGILVGVFYTLLVKYLVPPRLEVYYPKSTRDTTVTTLDLNQK